MTARPSHARSGGDPQRPTSSSRCRISVACQTAHAVGGRTVTARYKTVDLRLHPADPTASHYLEWQAQVGFIGGWHSYGPQHAQRQIRQTAPNLLAGNTHPASKGPVTTNSEPTAEVTPKTIKPPPDVPHATQLTSPDSKPSRSSARHWKLRLKLRVSSADRPAVEQSDG